MREPLQPQGRAVLINFERMREKKRFYILKEGCATLRLSSEGGKTHYREWKRGKMARFLRDRVSKSSGMRKNSRPLWKRGAFLKKRGEGKSFRGLVRRNRLTFGERRSGIDYRKN